MAVTEMDTRAEKDQSIRFEEKPVKILVGEAEHCFYVHATVLCANSQFFRSALKAEWKEGQDREVKLPSDSPDVFHKYAQWLYTGRIFKQLGADPSKDLTYPPLAELYVFAVKVLDVSCQDAVISSIISNTRVVWGENNNTNWYPIGSAIDTIYENTSPGSHGRRLMVNLWSGWGHSIWLTLCKEPVNREFLTDLTSVLLDEKNLTDKLAQPKYKQLKWGRPCLYHAHDQDKPCPHKME